MEVFCFLHDGQTQKALSYFSSIINTSSTALYFTLLLLLTVLVLQELWEVEEFWDELFDVVGIVHEGLPGGRNGVKLTVSTVKPATDRQSNFIHIMKTGFMRMWQP